MRSRLRPLVLAGALACRGLAEAQTGSSPAPEPPSRPEPVVPPTPPPPGEPPPPPLVIPPPPPFTEVAPPPLPPPPLPHYSLRLAVGFALIGHAVPCDSPTGVCPDVGGPITFWPSIDAELEVWFTRSPTPNRHGAWNEQGLALGLNVSMGDFSPFIGSPPPQGSAVQTTLWEPHADYVFGIQGEATLRIPVGVGVYIGKVTARAPGFPRLTSTSTGGALRVGAGVSFFASSPVGIAVDLLTEFGWIGSTLIANLQLLVGPELHFG